MQSNLLREILFRFIKIIDIAYIAILFFIVAYIFGPYLDDIFTYIYGTDFSRKTNTVLFLEILSQIICIGIISYIGRNIVEYIPFPLDGINGFVHSKVKELSSGTFFNVFFIIFQYSMQDKLMFIKKRQKQEINSNNEVDSE